MSRQLRDTTLDNKDIKENPSGVSSLPSFVRYTSEMTREEKLMTIFGKPLSQYVAFSKLFLGLILGVGITRLALSLGGVPNSTAKWFSMTAVGIIGMVYYAIRVHTSGFGSFKQLLVICTLQNLVAQAIAISGIVLAIITGAGNIFSAPEYAFGGDGRTWLHAGAHLVVGTTVGSLMPWLVGCAILAATRKLTDSDSKIKSLA
jgi:hypothetical protein